MAEKCKECGCECVCCTHDDEQHDMHLHVEIENLRQRLVERDNHIVTMETQFLNEADKFPNGELASMKDELLIWQEKYTRLHEAHKRVQKVNQNLEDKLLKIVDKCETEKSAFTKDIATLSHRLADANYTIHRLTQDNEKYRNDVNLAIQLLQCKPSNFVGQKYESLPTEVQAKVRTYVAQKRRSSDVNPPDVKSITVPISTFPPTAMVYNVTKPAIDKYSDDDSDESKPPVDIVSAAIMAKVLEDREKERIFARHCDTCSCHRSILMVDAETQTSMQDMFSCNECTMKFAQNDRDSLKSIDKSGQGKENQNTIMNTAYYEVNENSINNSNVQYHNNGNCAKNTNCQHLSTREKFVTRNGRVLEHLKDDSRMNMNGKININKKNSIRRNEAQMQNVFQNQNENLNKQAGPQNINDTCMNSKVNTEKSKQGRVNTVQTETKTNGNYWNESDKKAGYTPIQNPKTYYTCKDQTHIDIINDRLWKNEWRKVKSQVNLKDSRNGDKVNSDVEIDVINDRDWKNDRSNDTRHPMKLTLIEVKNIDNIVIQNDEKMDVATSPSFSSDSMMISTSDPSSSSSDVVQPVLGTQLTQNINNNIKSLGQNRINGPRNCLVRVTPGSKNILLDNAGHYKTVLYTSGSNKPNTALVHTKKSSRSGSERSMSTSGEENSPMLMHDNNQLQRVAEWVQSSVCMDNNVSSGYNTVKLSENIMDKSPSLMYMNENQTKYKIADHDGTSCGNVQGNRPDNAVINIDDFIEDGFDNDVKNLSLSPDVNCREGDKEKDLITFDVPNEEEKSQRNTEKENNSDFQYEVKITKEMEETYLKLAASLDPVTLSLSSPDNADLTIEKYRKDHKRLHVQRTHDKAGSKT